MPKLLMIAGSIVAALAVVGAGAAQTSGPITVPDDTTLTIAAGDLTVAYAWSASTTQAEPDSLFRCLNDAGNTILPGGSRNGPGSLGGTLDLGPGTHNFTCYQYVPDPTALGGLRFEVSLGWSVTVNLPTPAGQCSNRFTVSYSPGTKADRNGDGYVCVKGNATTDNNH